ncbi:hypothetical protein KGF56_000368 [Candida oxycetoniae]|uniref:Major facilitator superfamily (MFS) profile domain-containing protein n=1 Tax=Candida oxycetoniae TaxID=497107 RepID=A0AAI9T0T7_9ASCO|nr:uncharacterized protein KGF56_000368 [Candida oxycetoniae]KAI3406763.2 hypothetical protein KGF56_000368 [Candida oxycetoniae]
MSSSSSTCTVLTQPQQVFLSSPSQPTDLHQHYSQEIANTNDVDVISLKNLTGQDDLTESQYEPALNNSDANTSNIMHRRHGATKSPPSSSSQSSLHLMYGSENDPDNFPEGGKDAYLVMLGSFIGLIADFGIPNSLGAIESYISKNQLKDISNAQVGWVFSLNLSVMWLGGVFFGELFDKYGARKPLLAGTILMCLGLVLTAECTKLYQFILSFSILTALGTSIAMSPLIGVLSHWFLRRRALACSIATVGGLIGASCFTIMLQQLYGKIGYKNAIRVLACICFACMSVSIVLVKSRKKEEPAAGMIERTIIEVDASVDLENEATVSTKLKHYFRGVFDITVLKDMKFVYLAVAVSLAEIVSVTTLTYLGSYALAFDVNETSSYLLLTIVNVCGIPSRLLSGVIADKYGRFNVMLGTSILTTIFIFALWYPGKHILLLYVFGVFFGISTSAVLALIPACAGQICSSESFGKVYGNIYFILGVLNLLGMYFASLIISNGSQKSYSQFVLFEGGLSAASIIAWLFARSIAVGWKWCKF